MSNTSKILEILNEGTEKRGDDPKVANDAIGQLEMASEGLPGVIKTLKADMKSKNSKNIKEDIDELDSLRGMVNGGLAGLKRVYKLSVMKEGRLTEAFGFGKGHGEAIKHIENLRMWAGIIGKSQRKLDEIVTTNLHGWKYKDYLEEYLTDMGEIFQKAAEAMKKLETLKDSIND